MPEWLWFVAFGVPGVAGMILWALSKGDEDRQLRAAIFSGVATGLALAVVTFWPQTGVLDVTVSQQIDGMILFGFYPQQLPAAAGDVRHPLVQALLLADRLPGRDWRSAGVRQDRPGCGFAGIQLYAGLFPAGADHGRAQRPSAQDRRGRPEKVGRGKASFRSVREPEFSKTSTM